MNLVIIPVIPKDGQAEALRGSRPILFLFVVRVAALLVMPICAVRVPCRSGLIMQDLLLRRLGISRLLWRTLRNGSRVEAVLQAGRVTAATGDGCCDGQQTGNAHELATCHFQFAECHFRPRANAITVDT